MKTAVLAAFAVAATLLAGPQALGRVALVAGFPSVAARLLSDPAERGVALFRIGDYAGADAAFADAGRTQTYNRGLSLAGLGDYSLSVAYFDALLFANPADAEARANRDRVAALIDPIRGDSVVPGRILGAGGGAEGAQIATVSAGVQDPEWRRPIEARGIVASDEWLSTLSDDPGEFLKLRLKSEHDRRAALGLIRPVEAEPW